jgi:hypothetical protein
MCINHMTSLLVDHPKGFTWENYGVKWETDHIWQYDQVDWRKKWHRFKLNHYLNLQPLTPKENADKNYKWQLSKQATKKQKQKQKMKKQKRGRYYFLNVVATYRLLVFLCSCRCPSWIFFDLVDLLEPRFLFCSNLLFLISLSCFMHYSYRQYDR